MKQLIEGRTSVKCTDSPEEIAAFFEDLRAHRAGAAANAQGASAPSAGFPLDDAAPQIATSPLVPGDKKS